MTAETKESRLYHGGRQMEQLIDAFDWARTSVGAKNQWPHSLRTVVDVMLLSNVPMFLWWGDDMIQFYNDAYRIHLDNIAKHPSAFGQRGEECCPETWDTVRPIIDNVRSGTAVVVEDQRVPLQGKAQAEDSYWTFAYNPVRNDAGAVDGVLVICHETTKQVRALQTLRESESAIRSIFLNAPVGICILAGDPPGVELVNDIFLEMTGKSREEVLAGSFPEIFAKNQDKAWQLLKALKDTGTAWRGKEHEIHVKRSYGETTMYVDVVIEPIHTPYDPASRKLMLLTVDVTDKVLARLKVEESEQRYKTLLTESTVAIALYTGADFRIQYLNEIMACYWGKDLSVIGERLRDAVPELEGQRFLDILSNVFHSGESYTGTGEPALLRVGGKFQTFYFNYIYKPLKDKSGNVYAIHHMAMDVTEQVLAHKRIEELVAARTRELADSNMSLKRSNDELAQFAYIASHDLQEPARKIATFTEMLRRNAEGIDARSRTLLQKVEQASARMLALIRDVLAYSQLSRVTPTFSRIDLNVILKIILEDFELMIEEKRATVQSAPLPVIEGISVQISQLFGNLISNALKFTHKDRRPAVGLTCCALLPGEITGFPELNHALQYYRISVTDNGIGFNQKNAVQIFDIFQRLHGKGEYQGTGIGLAMCKKIALNHQGAIVAESVPGIGATFHVYLPESQT